MNISVNENKYLSLLSDLVYGGRREENRTGIDALVLPPRMLEADLALGVPVPTTKRFAFKACRGELIGFLQGKTSAADFRALGCNFWDANANDPGLPGHPNKWLDSHYRKGEDDLGRIYGAQWRDWDNGAGGRIDQVLTALGMIRNDPTSRRIIISAWRPEEFDQMALPPCHVSYQFLVNTAQRELSLAMYMRSTDVFLGLPMNMGSCALMLALFARMTGLSPRRVSIFMANPHLYVNHLEQAKQQLNRDPLTPPTLSLSIPLLGMASDDAILSALTPDSFSLVGYQSYDALPAPMAV
jgi:thymidylate synthase